jgi:hypothetical protein
MHHSSRSFARFSLFLSIRRFLWKRALLPGREREREREKRERRERGRERERERKVRATREEEEGEEEEAVSGIITSKRGEGGKGRQATPLDGLLLITSYPTKQT